MKRCPMSLIIREIQVKMYSEVSPHTGQYGSHPKIHKVIINTRVGVKKREHFTLLVGMWIGTATVENAMTFPQKINK